MALDDSQRVKKLLGELYEAHELFEITDTENTRLRAKVKKYRDKWKNATGVSGEDAEYILSEDEINDISEVDFVRAQLQKASDRIAELESNLEDCQRHKNLQPAQLGVSEEVKTLEKQISDRDARIALLEGQFRRQQQGACDVVMSDDEKLSEIANIRNDLEDCNKKVSHLESVNATRHQQTLESTQASIAQVQQELQASQSENEQLTKENDNLRESFEHIRTAGAELATTHQKAQTDIEELRVALQQVQADKEPPVSVRIGQDAVRYQILSNHQQALIRLLEKIIHDGFARRDRTTSTHPDHFAQLQEQQDRNEVAKREVVQVTRIFSLEQELATSRNQEAALQNTIIGLTSQLEVLNLTIAQLLRQEAAQTQALNYQQLENRMQLATNQLADSRQNVHILRSILQMAEDQNFQIPFHHVEKAGLREPMSIDDLLEQSESQTTDIRRLNDERTLLNGECDAMQIRNRQLFKQNNSLKAELAVLRQPRPKVDEAPKQAGEGKVEGGMTRRDWVRSMMTQEELAQHNNLDRLLELHITNKNWGTAEYKQLIQQQTKLENQVLIPARLTGFQRAQESTREIAVESDVNIIRQQRDEARSGNLTLQNRIAELTLAAGEWTRNAERIESLEEALRNATFTPHDMARYKKLRATAVAMKNHQNSDEFIAALAAVQEFQESIFFPPSGTSRRVGSEPWSGDLDSPTSMIRMWLVTIKERLSEVQNMSNQDMQAVIDAEGGFETLANFFDLSPLSGRSVATQHGAVESPEKQNRTVLGMVMKLLGSTNENGSGRIQRLDGDQRPMIQIEPAPRGNRRQIGSDDKNTGKNPNSSSLSQELFVSAHGEPGEDIEMSGEPVYSINSLSLEQHQAKNVELQNQVNELVEQRDELLATRDQQMTNLNLQTRQVNQAEGLVTTANIKIAKLRMNLNQLEGENSDLITKLEAFVSIAARSHDVLHGNSKQHDAHSTNITGNGNSGSRDTRDTDSNSNTHSRFSDNARGLDRQDTVLDGDYENNPCRNVIMVFHAQLCDLLDYLTGEVPRGAESPRTTLKLIYDTLVRRDALTNGLRDQNRTDARTITDLGNQLGQAIVDRQDRQKQIQQLQQHGHHASHTVRSNIINIANRVRAMFNEGNIDVIVATETVMGDLRRLEHQLEEALISMKNLKHEREVLRKYDTQVRAHNAKLRYALARCEDHGKQLSNFVDKLRQQTVEAGRGTVTSYNEQVAEIVQVLQIERDEAVLSRDEATARVDALQLQLRKLTLQRDGLVADMLNERAERTSINAYPLNNQERQKLQDEIHELREQLVELRKVEKVDNENRNRRERRRENQMSTLSAQLTDVQNARDNLRRAVVHYGGEILNDYGQVEGELVGAFSGPPLYPRPGDPRNGVVPSDHLTAIQYEDIHTDRNPMELCMMQRLATLAGLGVDHAQRGHFMNAVRVIYPEVPGHDSHEPPEYDARDRVQLSATSSPSASDHPSNNDQNDDDLSGNIQDANQSSGDQGRDGNENLQDQSRNEDGNTGAQNQDMNEGASGNEQNDGDDRRDNDARQSANTQQDGSSDQAGDDSSSSDSNDSPPRGPQGEREPIRRSEEESPASHPLTSVRIERLSNLVEPSLTGAELVRRAGIMGIGPLEYINLLQEQVLQVNPNASFHERSRELPASRRQSDEEFPSRNARPLQYAVHLDTQVESLPRGYQLQFDGEQNWAVPNDQAPGVDMDIYDAPRTPSPGSDWNELSTSPRTPAYRGHRAAIGSSPSYNSTPSPSLPRYNGGIRDSLVSSHDPHPGASPTRPDSSSEDEHRSSLIIFNSRIIIFEPSNPEELVQDENQDVEFDEDDLPPAFANGQDVSFGSNEGSEPRQQGNENRPINNGSSRSNNPGNNHSSSPPRSNLPSYGDNYEDGPCADIINSFRNRICALLNRFGERVSNLNREEAMNRLEVNVEAIIRDRRDLLRSVATASPRVRWLELEVLRLQITIRQERRQVGIDQARADRLRQEAGDNGEAAASNRSRGPQRDAPREYPEARNNILSSPIYGGNVSPDASGSQLPQGDNTANSLTGAADENVTDGLLSDCRETVEQLRGETQRLQQQIHILGIQLDFDRVKLDACRESGKAKNKQIDELMKKMRPDSEKDDRITEFEKELAEAQQQGIGLRDALADMTAQRNERRNAANMYETRLLNLSRVNTVTTGEKVRFQELLAGRTAQRDERIAKLEKELAACQKQLDACKARCSTIEYGSNPLQEERGDAEAGRHPALEPIAAHALERELQTEIHGLLRDITEHQRYLIASINRETALIAENQDLGNQIARLARSGGGIVQGREAEARGYNPLNIRIADSQECVPPAGARRNLETADQGVPSSSIEESFHTPTGNSSPRLPLLPAPSKETPARSQAALSFSPHAPIPTPTGSSSPLQPLPPTPSRGSRVLAQITLSSSIQALINAPAGTSSKTLPEASSSSDRATFYTPVGISSLYRPSPPPADGRSIEQIRRALQSSGRSVLPRGRDDSQALSSGKRGAPRNEENSDEDVYGGGSPRKKGRMN